MIFPALIAQSISEPRTIIVNNNVIVRVTSENRPVWLLLDTGSPTSVLFSSSKGSVKRKVKFAAGFERECRFQVQEMPGVRQFALASGIRLDGLLGLDILRQMVVKIDYRKARCEFDKLSSAIRPWLGPMYEEFDLQKGSDDFTLNVKLGQKTLPLTVDTGATTCAVDTLTLISTPSLARIFQGVSMTETSLTTTFHIPNGIDVAGRRLAFPVIGACGPDVAPGMVNPRFLTRDRLVLDLGHGKLYTRGAMAVEESVAVILSTLTAVPIDGADGRLRLASVPSLKQFAHCEVLSVAGVSAADLIQGLSGTEARVILEQLVQSYRKNASIDISVAGQRITVKTTPSPTVG